MEYEHEKKIRSSVELELFREGRYLPEYDGKVIEELKEVYAKAKAWDNYIAEVERDIRNITSNEDGIKWHIDFAINQYMEDK